MLKSSSELTPAVRHHAGRDRILSCLNHPPECALHYSTTIPTPDDDRRASPRYNLGAFFALAKIVVLAVYRRHLRDVIKISRRCYLSRSNLDSRWSELRHSYITQTSELFSPTRLSRSTLDFPRLEEVT